MAHDAVTIILPTHNRPQLLKRALHYYKGCGLPLLVVDSSSVAADLSAYGDMDLRYVHCPGSCYEKKLIQPLAGISTPYAAFTADDSFTLPGAVAACARFLEENPDHAAAYGRFISVAARPAGLVVDSCYDANTEGVLADTPGERLLQLFSRYVPPFYAVVRADVWRSTLAAPFERLRFYANLELLQAAVTAIYGKIAALPMLYSVVEELPSLGQASAHGLERLDSLPGMRAEFQAFIDHLASLLTRLHGLPMPEAQAVALRGLEQYIRLHCPPKAPKTAASRILRELRQGLRLLTGAKARARRLQDAQRKARVTGLFAGLSGADRAAFDSIASLVQHGYAPSHPHPNSRTDS